MFNTVLNLSNDYNKNFKNYKKKFRPAIKKYKREMNINDFKIIKINNKNELFSNFYKILQFAYIKKHLMIPQPYYFFKNVYNFLAEKNIAEFYTIINQKKKPVSTILCFKYKNSFHYVWGATIPEYEKYSFSSVLVDYLIQKSIIEKYEYFDFGATSVEQYNLLFAKEKFGAESKRLPFYYFSQTGRIKVLDTHSSCKLFRKSIYYCPLFIVRYLSKIIVKIFK